MKNLEKCLEVEIQTMIYSTGEDFGGEKKKELLW